jgi:farnesyl diphosphate synthase
MNPDVDWAVWARERQQRIESVLERLLPPPESAPRRLHEAMRYAVLGGGKRVRALLAYAAGEFAQADPVHVDAVAAALEMMHAYSLVHDDLPCMDDDVLRRGKPTCHVRFDEATAMLAGDALQSLAFEVLARDTEGVVPAARVRMVVDFARASGAAGMAGGQAIDLDSVGGSLRLEELEAMHRMKTGALIHAAVRLGACCGRGLDADGDAALARYARTIGLAFQVVDDVLDVEGSAQELGKTPGKDVAQNKPTYVTLLGLAAARARAGELLAAALREIEPLGARARRLRELAGWIVARTH